MKEDCFKPPRLYSITARVTVVVDVAIPVVASSKKSALDYVRTTREWRTDPGLDAPVDGKKEKRY